MDRAELERLDRESLVLRAQAAGIKRARVLTRPELVDELVRLDPKIDAAQLKRSRGFFGLARDLLSRVVERGLHLPDAAERFRAALADPLPQVPRPEPQAIPTVTLAEIYAAQGHKQRAVDTLKRVLADEPDHGAARALLEKLQAADYVAPEPKLPPEPEVEPAAAEAEAEVELESEPEPEPEPVIADLPSVKEPMPPTPRVQPALPSQDGDRCVAVPAADGTWFVWWQLSPRSFDLAEESFFFVRLVAIVPSWNGPDVRVQDLAVDPVAGELVAQNLPRGAIVRAAIGFMAGGELVPVAHSPAIELGRDGEGALVHWRFGDMPSVLEEPIVRAAIARAPYV